MGIETEVMRKLVPERFSQEEAAPTAESAHLRAKTAALVRTAANAESVHSRQDQLIAAFQEAFGQDLCKIPRHVEVAADGAIVVHGSLYLDDSADHLLPNLRVEGVLNISKASAITDIPDGIFARSFIPNAATAHLKDRVRPIPAPDGVRAA